MNLRALASDKSSQLTPTSVALPCRLRAKRSSTGASCSQGSHQLAQKLTSTGCPRREASVVVGPERCSNGKGGAERPSFDLLPARPTTTNTNRASTTAAPISSVRGRGIVWRSYHQQPCTDRPARSGQIYNPPPGTDRPARKRADPGRDE